MALRDACLVVIMKSINRISPAALALLLCLSAPAAWAHGTIPGINQFYNGVVHPFLAPAHLLSLLALALLAGQQGLRPRPVEVIALAGGFMVGAAAAFWAGDPDTDTCLWAVTLWAGVGVALARSQPKWLRAATGGLIGLAIGLGSADVSLHEGKRIAALLGAGFGAMVLVAYAAMAVDALTRRIELPAARIGIRVVASWLTACALLMLALAWKKSH
jgi:hydrogenase/urease accessory protein HupE